MHLSRPLTKYSALALLFSFAATGCGGSKPAPADARTVLTHGGREVTTISGEAEKTPSDDGWARSGPPREDVAKSVPARGAPDPASVKDPSSDAPRLTPATPAPAATTAPGRVVVTSSEIKIAPTGKPAVAGKVPPPAKPTTTPPPVMSKKKEGGKDAEDDHRGPVGGVVSGTSDGVPGLSGATKVPESHVVSRPTPIEVLPPISLEQESKTGGLLTAANWDDNKHRDSFLTFLNRYPSYREEWGMDMRQRVLLRVEDSAGVLVGDASMAMRLPDGRIVNLRTHGDGTTWFYPKALPAAFYGPNGPVLAGGYSIAAQVGTPSN